MDDSDDLSGVVRLRHRQPCHAADKEGTLAGSSGAVNPRHTWCDIDCVLRATSVEAMVLAAPPICF